MQLRSYFVEPTIVQVENPRHRLMSEEVRSTVQHTAYSTPHAHKYAHVVLTRLRPDLWPHPLHLRVQGL